MRFLRNTSFYLLLCFLSFSTSCSGENEVVLVGKLGEFSSFMHLMFKGSKVSGSFSYTNQKLNTDHILLEGELLGNHLLLREFSNEEKELSGLFIGTLNDDTYSGRWESPAGSQKVAFSYTVDATAKILSTTTTSSAGTIRYDLVEDGDLTKLVAYRGQSTYTLLPNDFTTDAAPVIIDTVVDLNGDGYEEALVVMTHGNGHPGDLWIHGYDPNTNSFFETDAFASSWNRATIVEDESEMHIIVSSASEGVDLTDLYYSTETFVLRGRQVELIEQTGPELMSAIAEVWSADIPQEGSEPVTTLRFDLDGDGISEEIKTDYWFRWGRMNWTLKMSSTSHTVKSDGAVKRLGVLASRTNGVHDLVADFDIIYRWDGNTYVSE